MVELQRRRTRLEEPAFRMLCSDLAAARLKGHRGQTDGQEEGILYMSQIGGRSGYMAAKIQLTWLSVLEEWRLRLYIYAQSRPRRDC